MQRNPSAALAATLASATLLAAPLVLVPSVVAQETAHPWIHIQVT